MKNIFFLLVLTSLLSFSATLQGGESGYFEKVFPAPENPSPGELPMAAEWRIWIPEGVDRIRGVVVHQHGCGNGSGDGGRTAVYDLHWQELARKHDCALIASSFRLDDRPCEQWCDPRNGSAQSFFDALEYFAEFTGHEELTSVPWALWGHSGGGQWVGSMTQLYPQRIVAAWLRSGCPDTVVKIFDELPMNDDVLNVPMMLNIGAHEYDFGIVWVSCWNYICHMRAKNAKIGFMVDPSTHHETGSSRYPAIRFLDDMLTLRLPLEGTELLPAPQGLVLPIDRITDQEISADNIVNDPEKPDGNYDSTERRKFLKDGLWFPSEEYVVVWRKYSIDNTFEDQTPPPAPFEAFVNSKTGIITWRCRADVESGLKTFAIYRDGVELTQLPTANVVNSRPVFQGVMYSDTPDFSLPEMKYQIPDYDAESGSKYTISAFNTAGLESEKVIVVVH